MLFVNLIDFFLPAYFGDEDFFFFSFPADEGDASHYIKSTFITLRFRSTV